MIEPKKVMYTVTCNNISFPIECWEGTTLGQVWNTIKTYYLSGSIVTIEDNNGKSMKFMKGMI